MRVEEVCGFGKGAKPEVGMLCTLHMYSDSQACEVVKVSKSGKTCWIRRNLVILIEKGFQKLESFLFYTFSEYLISFSFSFCFSSSL